MAKYNYVAENDISDEEYSNVLADLGEVLDPTFDAAHAALVEKATRALTEGWKDFHYIGPKPLPPVIMTKGEHEWFIEASKNWQEALGKYIPSAIGRLKDISTAKALAAHHRISPWWLLHEEGIHTDTRPVGPAWIEALRVSIEAMGRRYGAYEPPTSWGGWDSEGAYGASRHDIKNAWVHAGKVANGKFRWLVTHRHALRVDNGLSGYGTPEMGFLKEWARGMAIWHRAPHNGDGRHIYDGVAIALGLLPLEEAETAVAAGKYEFATYSPMWGATSHEEAQTRRSIRQWTALVGEEGAHRARAESRGEHPREEGGWMPPKGATPEGVGIVLASMTDAQKRDGRGFLNDAAIIAAKFKGHESLIPAYVAGLERLHDGTHLPVRDGLRFYGDWLKCLCDPVTRGITPTYGWGEFEKAHGKPTHKSLVKSHTATLGGRFTQALYRIFGKDVPEAYEGLRQRGSKNHETIPAPGGVLGLKVGKFVVRQLAHDDMTAPAVGIITNCCQHLRGAARHAAEQTYTDATSAVWVVEEAGKIVAQAWVWRTTTDGIHLDSVEALGSRTRFSEAFKAAAEAAVGRLGVSVVTAGGDQWDGKRVTVTPVTPLGYVGDFDGKGTVLAGNVAKRSMSSHRTGMDGYRRVPLPTQGEPVVVPPTPAPTHNEKPDQDYETLCEHCWADVHPDATECWNCRIDISEWV
jgi:hypothetical protein